jgi:hypothetical protein
VPPALCTTGCLPSLTPVVAEAVDISRVGHGMAIVRSVPPTHRYRLNIARAHGQSSACFLSRGGPCSPRIAVRPQSVSGVKPLSWGRLDASPGTKTTGWSPPAVLTLVAVGFVL